MDISQRARFSGLAVGLAYGIGLNKNLKSHKNSKKFIKLKICVKDIPFKKTFVIQKTKM